MRHFWATCYFCLMFIGVFFVTLARAEDVAILPDYEKEAKIPRRVTCDDGLTSGVRYKGNGYMLDIANTRSESLFYMIMFSDHWHFFIKIHDSSNPVEISHEEWDKRLKAESPNAFKKAHGFKNDCVFIQLS